MTDAEFLGDTTMLLRPDLNFNAKEAYELVRERLIDYL